MFLKVDGWKNTHQSFLSLSLKKTLLFIQINLNISGYVCYYDFKYFIRLVIV